MGLQADGKKFRQEMTAGNWVELGDARKASFQPHLRAARWDDECSLTMRLPYSSPHTLEPQLDARRNRLDVAINSDFSLVLNHIQPGKQFEQGGYDFAVLCHRRPAKDRVLIELDLTNLKAHYQPALTAAEIADGAHRPENVAGSFAVYHATRQPWHRSPADALKYRAGKAFHIYRPKWIAADGAESWGWLELNKGELACYGDPAFFAAHPAPYLLDPEFGYESPGASNYNFENRLYGNVFTGAAGTAVSMSAYYQTDGYHKMRMGIYDHLWDEEWTRWEAIGPIENGVTEEITPAAATDWVTAEFGIGPSLSATDYGLVAGSEFLVEHSVSQIRWDTTDGITQVFAQGFTYPTWPGEIATTANVTRTYSIYCTYTAAEGGGMELPLMLNLSDRELPLLHRVGEKEYPVLYRVN